MPTGVGCSLGAGRGGAVNIGLLGRLLRRDLSSALFVPGTVLHTNGIPRHET